VSQRHLRALHIVAWMTVLGRSLPLDPALRTAGIGAKLPNAEPRAAGAGRDPTATRNSARVSSARSAGALAVHQRDYVSGEPLQALDALRNGLAAAIEDQLVHADRCESSNVAGDVFRLAGEGPAGPVR
jgi:hypothetical protein